MQKAGKMSHDSYTILTPKHLALGLKLHQIVHSYGWISKDLFWVVNFDWSVLRTKSQQSWASFLIFFLCISHLPTYAAHIYGHMDKIVQKQFKRYFRSHQIAKRHWFFYLNFTQMGLFLSSSSWPLWWQNYLAHLELQNVTDMTDISVYKYLQVVNMCSW